METTRGRVDPVGYTGRQRAGVGATHSTFRREEGDAEASQAKADILSEGRRSVSTYRALQTENEHHFRHHREYGKGRVKLWLLNPDCGQAQADVDHGSQSIGQYQTMRIAVPVITVSTTSATNSKAIKAKIQRRRR